MDLDTESPLNRAHRYHRKAEDYERQFRFDAAIKCHAKASQSLEEALTVTSNPKSQESIRAQLAFHRNQETFLGHRKEYFHKRSEELRKKSEESRKKTEMSAIKQNLRGGANGLEANMSSLHLRDTSDSDHTQANLENAIYRVIEEHDSLLAVLFRRQEDENEAEKTGIDKSSSSASLNSSLYKSGAKVPKGDETVIEELRINNTQLRELVGELLNQLEKLQTENQQLRGDLVRMEEDRERERRSSESNLPELPPLEPPKLLY
jgi:hypothetical protein